MALTKVTNTGIADDAVTTDKIEDGTVVAADIAPGTIANAKLANSSITLNGSSVSLGGSANLKHIDWQALTVADGSTTLNAEAGKGYFLDTNAGVIEVFLPSSPTRGDTVVLADYSGTFGTNQIIINTGGELLDSTAGNDFKVTTNNSIVELIYVDSAKGWLVKLNQAAGTTPDSALTEGNIYDQDATFISATGGTITTSGDFKIHTFTGDGCFVVSCAPSGAAPGVDYLVVAGGGGGGSDRGGGGGAGGTRFSASTFTVCGSPGSPIANPTGITVSASTYPITVGAGGTGSPCVPGNTGCAGSNSVFSTITSAGGGFGGASPGGGGSGGSGGGGGCGGPRAGGSGNTPPVSPPQGTNGGTSAGGEVTASSGGGAIGAGENGGPSNRADGGTGAGLPTAFGSNGEPSGCFQYYGGGGGAGGGDALIPFSPNRAAGGLGGGGQGGTSNNSTNLNGEAADANTGGGGGGGGNNNSAGNGGKGIVVLRYKFQ